MNELKPEIKAELEKRGIVFTIEENLPVFQKENIQVRWTALGESIWGGDYDKNKPLDEEVLRFDVLIADEDSPEVFKEVLDGSFCTQVSKRAPFEELVALLLKIFDGYYPVLKKGESCKRIGERLSWLSSENIKTGTVK